MLYLDLQHLLLREDVAHPAVLGTSVTSKEEVFKSIHQAIHRLNLNVLRVLGDFWRKIVASKNRMIWVQLHDCEQGPLDCGEVAFF